MVRPVATVMFQRQRSDARGDCDMGVACRTLVRKPVCSLSGIPASQGASAGIIATATAHYNRRQWKNSWKRDRGGDISSRFYVANITHKVSQRHGRGALMQIFDVCSKADGQPAWSTARNHVRRLKTKNTQRIDEICLRFCLIIIIIIILILLHESFIHEDCPE